MINCINFLIDLGIPDFWSYVMIPCLVLLEMIILTIIIKQGMIKLKIERNKIIF